MGDRTEKRKQIRKKKIRRAIIISTVTLFVAVAVLVGPLLVQAWLMKKNMTNDLGRGGSALREEVISLKNNQPVSILVLGVDEEDGVSRSDTMMVLTINPKRGDMKMMSIPRDMRVAIPDEDVIGMQKINAAYAHDGAKLAIETVEKEFDVPIDYYVSVNFKAFVDMVDIVGGVDVDNDFAFTLWKYSFEEGPQTLNGKEALHYVRMRKSDPEGDYGRQKRQQEVLQDLVAKSTVVNSLTKLDEIFSTVGENVQTDLLLREIWALKNEYSDAARNAEAVKINAESEKVNSVFYEIVNYEERVRLSKLLREHLELPGEPNLVNEDYRLLY